MTSGNTIPLIQQVRDALEQFIDAHTDAEGKIAAAASLKLVVGGNAEDRKKQAASMSAQEYEGYSISYASAEIQRQKAVAHLERTEKTLNVLREELAHETAEINRAWAEIADRTAQRYAVIAMTPPARPIVLKHHDTADLPF